MLQYLEGYFIPSLAHHPKNQGQFLTATMLSSHLTQHNNTSIMSSTNLIAQLFPHVFVQLFLIRTQLNLHIVLLVLYPRPYKLL